MPKLMTSRPIPSHSIVKRIQGYDPICLFARGGMAQVFLARKAGARPRLVAIKTLKVSYMDDQDRVAMFADEMRLTHLLSHPNIVELVEAGVIEGEPFLVLEFIDGPSLRELSNYHATMGWAMDVRLTTSLIYWVCQGLHYAHELVDEWGTPLRLVHRDINPQNLMVTRGGVIKVLDFGVAKAVGQSHQTVGRGVKGKIAYAAPEYIKGDVPDRRADVFALGVVLWELLTNARLFFKATAVGTMQAVVNDAAAPPSSLNSAVMPVLDELTLAAVEKAPERRVPDAARLASGLREAASVLGGLLSPEEIADVLVTEYAAITADRIELDPKMSDDELRRHARSSIVPDGSPIPRRPSDLAESWSSVEIDLGIMDERTKEHKYDDEELAFDEDE